MESKGNRKVRFTLPGLENYIIFGNNNDPYQTTQQHITSRYVNGTLVTPPVKAQTTETQEDDSTPYHNQNQEVTHNNNFSSNSDNKISMKIPTASILNDTFSLNDNFRSNNEIIPNRKIIKENTRFIPKNPAYSTVKIQIPNVNSLPAITNKCSSVEDISKITTSPVNKLKSKKFSFNNNKSSDDLQSLISKDDEAYLKDSKINNKKEIKIKSRIKSGTVKKSNYFNFNYIKKNKSDSRRNSISSVNNTKKIVSLKSNILDCPAIKVSLSDQFDKKNQLKQTKLNENISNFLSVPNETDFYDDNSEKRHVVEFSKDCTKQHKQLWKFIERWSICRSVENEKNEFNNNMVSEKYFIRSDGKKGSSLLKKPFRSIKMSLEKLPNVPTLLRAAREHNEHLLQQCLDDILENGITKDELNAADLNGRTAISYICSTNLTHILDDLLRVPQIDVNKCDNEGNVPLHFAAQAGFCEIINMLLTRSRSLKVDAKNNLGFTPLMKAALQGRNKCAKLLLFAGASPIEIDSGRGLRAEQWARFCGRYTCAEMIEKCARTRLLSKSTSCRLPNEINSTEKTPIFRTKTNPPASTNNGTIRSKLRKVFPFGFSLREKSNSPKTMDCNNELVKYLTAATVAIGPIVNNTENPIKSIIRRPLEVPKLEVTPVNNQALIKKYENAKYFETEDGQSSPTSRWKYKY